MLFDCSALLLGLGASLVAKWRPNEKFTYGFGRAETLAGLANGLFLLFIAMFIMKEAVERTFEPPEVHHERLFVISVLGFIVNLIGIFVFQHGGQGHHHNHIFGGSCSSHSHEHSHDRQQHHNHHHADELHGLYSAPTISSEPSLTQPAEGLVALDMNGYSSSHSPSAIHSHSHNHKHNDHNSNSHTHHHHDHDYHQHYHHHSHQNGSLDSATLIHEDFSPSMPSNRPFKSNGRGQIMQSVFLHIVADTLGSVGVMISAVLMSQFGWMIADPLCSLFIAILISISVYPLLRDAVYILMQRIPVDIEDKLADCLHRIGGLPGVQAVHDAHFWTLSSDLYIGCLKVDVAKDADRVYVQNSTKRMLSDIGVDRINVEIDIV